MNGLAALLEEILRAHCVDCGVVRPGRRTGAGWIEWRGRRYAVGVATHEQARTLDWLQWSQFRRNPGRWLASMRPGDMVLIRYRIPPTSRHFERAVGRQGRTGEALVWIEVGDDMEKIALAQDVDIV